MKKAKTHYRSDAGNAVVESNRVAAYCGAITVSAWPGEAQVMVRETSDTTWVDCGNCRRRLSKEEKL